MIVMVHVHTDGLVYLQVIAMDEFLLINYSRMILTAIKV